MIPESCMGCAYHKRQYGNDLCTRPIPLKSGLVVDYPRFCWQETVEDSTDTEQVCGPSRRHFKAGSVM